MNNTEEESKQSKEDQLNEEETILFRNIDANVDKYAIELEKQIQKLPNPLRFIKKYVHFYFLPRLENILDELESIRQTPNYDEKAVKIRPVSTSSITSEIISCIDLLNNNNISHPKISKMIFGTMKGNLGIYDFDTGRIVLEMNISKQNRVEHITTSTIKYFDTYQTRIAANCRGESNIYILSYNHSFTGITTECILNTINPEESSPPAQPDKMNLSNIVCELKLSKDSYFLSVTDYAGGVRIFNFAELAVQGLGGGAVGIVSQQSNNLASESNEENNVLKNTGESNKDNEKNTNLNEKKSTLVISSLPQVGEQKLNFIYVGRFLPNKTENYTILPNEAQQVDDKNKKNSKDNPKDKKKEIKKGKPNEEEIEDKNPEEYNIKSEFDEEKGDISMFQNKAENHPWVHFVQKRFIFEDNSNSEYSTSTITIGLYIAFSNSTCFKFISLNEYLTDKMKSVFKVKKIKNNFIMSIEDSMNLNSQMLKKEKDFLQFIRQKLDPKKQSWSGGENPDQEYNLSSENKSNQEKDKKPSMPNQKAKIDVKNNKGDNIGQNTGKSFANINNVNSLLTKKEMNFTTCFNITIMNGQKEINKYNNLIGIGMIDGSILVWDCELHTDKFLLQKNSRFEITSISIDENYLICGTIKGQIYIYDLIEGKELFNCAHDPYSVSSFQNFMSFFPFMSIGFDDNNRICIYNSKEAHKIGKLILSNDLYYTKEENRISYYNKFLCDYNDKYVVFICEKKTKENNSNSENKNILDLINFSKKRVEILRDKPNDKITNFFNMKISELNTQLVKPEMNKSNSNINMTKDNKESGKNTVTNLKKDKDKDKKLKGPKQKEENIPQEEEQITEPITKLDLKENIIVVYRVLDILFKCYPNLAYSQKKGISLRKVMKKYNYNEYPTFSASEIKKEGIMSNIKYLSSDLKKRNSNDLGSNLKKDLTGMKNEEKEEKVKKDKKQEKIDKYNSTQRKDIFYNSFKNIKERHHYKEERVNLLQHQKKKIINELKAQNGKNKKK